jgi:transcription-repair coupling factor (superfamily II helicase)
MHSIGFTLYSEMLADTVKLLKEGKKPDLDKPLRTGTEVNLRIPALLPDAYLPDVHGRLQVYKRVASAHTDNELRDLKVELIDRFGLLPDATRNLFEVTRLKLLAEQLGIEKIEASGSGGKFRFAADTPIDPMTLVRLVQRESNRYSLGGANELKFRQETATPQDRIAMIEQLLFKLANPSAPAGGNRRG